MRRLNRAIWTVSIVFVSASIGMLVDWRAPGLNAYAHDWLMRARGPVSAPTDIVIVGIDDESIKRIGRFPWPRSRSAEILSIVSSAHPRVIALDVLYSEPTSEAEDRSLSDAMARSGKVVTAAQLVEGSEGTNSGGASWLRPLPVIEKSAAAVGHVNVSSESDGSARELLLRESDEEGNAFWSMAIQAVRVGDGTSEADIQVSQNEVRIKARSVPATSEPASVSISGPDADSEVQILSPQRMRIDYIGPTGSFGANTYSFADVIEKRVSPEVFRDKYVLIGATAATLGERIASPFVHSEDATGRQHGVLMPGVEVLANAINTILRARFYRQTSEWASFLCAILVAVAALGLLAVAQGRSETTKQLAVLGGLLAVILLSAYVAFTRLLIIPPLVPALISFVCAAPLALLRRSLATSAELDARIDELARAGVGFAPFSDQLETAVGDNGPAELIARLTEADAVAIFARRATENSNLYLVASHGAPAVQSLRNGNRHSASLDLMNSASIAEPFGESVEAAPYFTFGGDWASDLVRRERALRIKLGACDNPIGALVIAHPFDRELPADGVRLAREIAFGYLAIVATAETRADADRTKLVAGVLQVPRGVEWKTHALGVLARNMLARARFVDRALHSIEDGLIVADVQGRIRFANPRAARIFGVSEQTLIGDNLFERLSRTVDNRNAPSGVNAERLLRDTLLRLVVDRAPVEREVTLGEGPPRHYMLRLSSVTADDNGGPVLGLVASLSDITKHRELEKTKNEVMALVTHELRTPLTAIQGMSELLAQFEVDGEQRRQMHLAINDEAKRLARMIEEYLDITRLESGTRSLRVAPVRLAPLVERALLMLDPVAAQRGTRILRRFAPNLPALIADGDLLAQAVTNLVANAIKYSSPDNEVIVSLRVDAGALLLKVRDHGYGIPSDALAQVFEKFYRVPRVEDADVPGTGLGLAVVREIAERHGGRVTVDSEPGVGSVFTLSLPVTPTTDDASEVMNDRDHRPLSVGDRLNQYD